jgi:hypothetical protein
MQPLITKGFNATCSIPLELPQKWKGEYEKYRWRETGRPSLPSQWFPCKTNLQAPPPYRITSVTSALDTRAQNGVGTKEAAMV